jgi:uncharacterized protein with HEPN domain
MRPEELYLSDIVEAADSIAHFLTGVRQDTFVGDDLLRSAVLHKLTIIGEAASRLPREFRDRYPEIEWADIAAFRNIAVHAYFAIDWSVVWVAATQDAPDLRDKVANILAQEYPGPTVSNH